MSVTPGHPGTSRPGAPLQTMKTMATTMVASSLMLGIAVYFSVSEWTEPPLWMPLAQVVLAVGAFALAETIGFATGPIPVGLEREEAMRRSVQIWQARTFLRFALSEAVVLVGVVLAFVGMTVWPFVVGFVLGVPLLAYEMFPTRRTIDKLKQNLERDGGQSGLDEALTP